MRDVGDLSSTPAQRAHRLTLMIEGLWRESHALPDTIRTDALAELAAYDHRAACIELRIVAGAGDDEQNLRELDMIDDALRRLSASWDDVDRSAA